jgi:hypothetical protein
MKEKITNEELLILLSLIRTYSKASDDLESYSMRLEEIEREKTKLLDEVKKLSETIQQVRIQEDQITQALVEKYGPFKLNMETFEIEPA